MNKIEPFLPIYSRKPNKLLKYIEEDFDDGCNHLAIIRNAIFQDKNGKEQSCVAQVIWKIK